jgi:hypothetical protein
MLADSSQSSARQNLHSHASDAHGADEVNVTTLTGSRSATTITRLPPPLPRVLHNPSVTYPSSSSSSSSSSGSSLPPSSSLASSALSAASSALSAASCSLSYEEKRLENIRRNQAMLASLQLPHAKASLQRSVHAAAVGERIDGSSDPSLVTLATQRYRRTLQRGTSRSSSRSSKSSSSRALETRHSRITPPAASRTSRRVRGQTPGR